MCMYLAAWGCRAYSVVPRLGWLPILGLSTLEAAQEVGQADDVKLSLQGVTAVVQVAAQGHEEEALAVAMAYLLHVSR